jgi:hypothetical protein
MTLRGFGGAAIVAIVALAAATSGLAQGQKQAQKPSSKAAPAAAREMPAERIKRLEADLRDLAIQNSVLIDRKAELEAELAALKDQVARLRQSANGTVPPAPPEGQQKPPAMSPVGQPVSPATPVAGAQPPSNAKPPAPGGEGDKPPPVDLSAAVRAACGLRLEPESGAPGAKDLIIVSVQRRTSIEAAARASGAPAPDIEAVNVDACFSAMGAGTDYVLAAPADRRDQTVAVIGGDGSPLGEWLTRSALEGERVRLAPSSECTMLLGQIAARLGPASAVWVEQDNSTSRCERDSDGSATVNPNKIDGYSGVVVLKARRG